MARPRRHRVRDHDLRRLVQPSAAPRPDHRRSDLRDTGRTRDQLLRSKPDSDQCRHPLNKAVTKPGAIHGVQTKAVDSPRHRRTSHRSRQAIRIWTNTGTARETLRGESADDPQRATRYWCEDEASRIPKHSLALDFGRMSRDRELRTAGIEIRTRRGSKI